MKSNLTCNIHLLSFFFWNYSIHGFSLVWKEKLWWYDERQGGSIHLCSIFCVSSSCLKIRHKNGCIGESREEEVMYYDWVPTPDFPSLDSPWMEMFIGLQTYWILLKNQTQNDKHIIKQCVWSDILQVCVHFQVVSVGGSMFCVRLTEMKFLPYPFITSTSEIPTLSYTWLEPPQIDYNREYP